MLDRYTARNFEDKEGLPAGGNAASIGVQIKWQDGPLGTGESRSPPNGASVETVIDIARQRLQYYQRSKLKCEENAVAMTKLVEALNWLDFRTKRRERQKIEGTPEGLRDTG